MAGVFACLHGLHTVHVHKQTKRTPGPASPQNMYTVYNTIAMHGIYIRSVNHIIYTGK